MPTQLGWQEIALRLALATLAGTLIGLERGGHGRPAGLRTILLVCLAAAVSMIQTNLLLPLGGRRADSFVTVDLMRLPLGILTGMGFIGGGAIVRKGDVVQGVTTAATLWFVTVIGLCFGGGQNTLGLAATGLGLVVLRVLKPIESLLPHELQATLTVTAPLGGTTEDDVRRELLRNGFQIVSEQVEYDIAAACVTLCCVVRWRMQPPSETVPDVVKDLSRRPDITRLGWRPVGGPNTPSTKDSTSAAD